jgi:hypothetical protein
MIFDENFRISGDNVNLLDDLYHLPSSYDFLPKRFDILDQEI